MTLLPPDPRYPEANKVFSLREKIRDEKAARVERYALFERAWAAAEAAAATAARGATPTPMIVYTPGADNKPAPGTPVYHVDEGACGFAWVKVFPANCSFAVWARKTKNVGGRDYGGGLTIMWCPAGATQSIARQEAAADAACEVFRKILPDLKVFSQSRLD